MKTKGQFQTAFALFQKVLTRRVLILVGFTLFWAGQRFFGHRLPHGTFSWMPFWVALVFFVLGPVLIIHLLIGGRRIRRSAQECGLACPSCHKALLGVGMNPKKAIEMNRCPFCQSTLYSP
jgi:hypothetical protein